MATKREIEQYNQPMLDYPKITGLSEQRLQELERI